MKPGSDLGLDHWRGSPIDPLDEPWFRFGRVCDLLDRHVAIPAGSKWLDLGCQIGQFLKLASARYGVLPAGIDDFDRTNIVAVCKRYFRLSITDPEEVLDGSWRYFSRRIDEVGFDLDEVFPFISALEIIEHMVDTDAFIGECRAHIQDGGFLVISTPNINSLRNRFQVLVGRYPAGLEYRTLVHHVRLYNAATLTSQLSEHGFRLIDMAGGNFFPKRFLGSRVMRTLDAWLSDLFPSLCGGLLALFTAEPGERSRARSDPRN